MKPPDAFFLFPQYASTMGPCTRTCDLHPAVSDVGCAPGEAQAGQCSGFANLSFLPSETSVLSGKLIHEFLQRVSQKGLVMQSEQDIHIGNSGKICAQRRRQRFKTMLKYIYQKMYNISPDFSPAFFSAFFPAFFSALIDIITLPLFDTFF